MPNPSRRRLVLVDEPVQTDYDAREAEGLLNPGRYSLPEHGIPFCIRLTMDQVMQVAEEVDLRAQMLEWSIKEMPSNEKAVRKVNSLHDVAIGLRRVASYLKDGWSEPRDT